MTSWADVLGKGFDFLARPTAQGVVTVALVLAFLVYVTPMAVVAGLSVYNTYRLENAIQALGQDLRQSTVAEHR